MGKRIGVYAATDFARVPGAVNAFKLFNEPDFKRSDNANKFSFQIFIPFFGNCRPSFAADSSVGVQSRARHVLVGIGSLESSFVARNVPAIDDVQHADLAPLMLFYQYLVQLEVSFQDGSPSWLVKKEWNETGCSIV